MTDRKARASNVGEVLHRGVRGIMSLVRIRFAALAGVEVAVGAELITVKGPLGTLSFKRQSGGEGCGDGESLVARRLTAWKPLRCGVRSAPTSTIW